MKSLFHTALAALLFMGMSACQGSDTGEEPTDPEDKPLVGPYTLVVDKTEFEADGKDAITFTLKDANGTNVTAGNQASYVFIKDADTDNSLGSKVLNFTAIKNGTYKFKATYKNAESENTVTVTAKNRQKYEKYFRNVAVYELTNVYCPNCPLMADGLANTPAEWKQHMALLAIHGPFDNNDPFILGGGGNYVANSLFIKFNNGSAPYPACLYNLDTFVSGGGVNARPTTITKLLEEQMRKYPATSGIRVISSSIENKVVKINVGFTSSMDGKYDLGYALLLDNQEHASKSYNHVAVAMSPNYMSISNASACTATSGTEIQKEYTFENINFSDSQKANCQVVVFVLRPEGDGAIIDNVMVCKLGDSADYKLNE